ncbi:methylthioribulose-1-phosphate dehydratase [Cytobacillus horneckiae]|uniref:Methylthioribulose-1-phosphate dehydratase n=1 Tax=Cytobacillus horneckiae TaxID=549687 RepID=A0A2N0ZEW6_9BACI|nr:methylthioribulose 1-phosphate dehydratase [Cytobacillus horneckiae]MBN6889455.1 methylthioribulose 1-phosphate dehydratase [Cytobacillus horneckiae]MCM3176860.1 methylthioribulose 1-phosphate dehydratase [Cytobacillus horneckiae]MEC1156703.1 methylthioribulose 1-phosphate dehydratase [Cytobacillus horneckiae]MED2939076.1 methylthioribulose 1-phosphate dehydratase [Cytobacillus horneckiae]PKG28023.1 methylthioribulose 1-phosphate dehydratase [Cytobacillus horneckiae]
MSEFNKKWNELAYIKDELAVRDWFMGTSGNLSIRLNDNHFLVTASGKDKRKRTSEDFLLVDQEGKPAETTFLKPSAETLLHCEVYRQTEAGCSLHVHTIANNVISELYGDAGEIRFQHQELIKAFDMWGEDDILSIPIIKNFADIPKLAAAFGEHINSDKGAVLIRNHGITVWGRTGFEAKKLLEACEFLFQYKVTLLTIKGGL